MQSCWAFLDQALHFRLFFQFLFAKISRIAFWTVWCSSDFSVERWQDILPFNQYFVSLSALLSDRAIADIRRSKSVVSKQIIDLLLAPSVILGPITEILEFLDFVAASFEVQF